MRDVDKHVFKLGTTYNIQHRPVQHLRRCDVMIPVQSKIYKYILQMCRKSDPYFLFQLKEVFREKILALLLLTN